MGITNPSRVEVQDEGSTQGLVDQFDFTGAGVTASVSGRKATVTVAGGGSVSAPITGAQATGDFTIADGQFGIQGMRLTLTGSQRGTVAGSGRLLILG